MADEPNSTVAVLEPASGNGAGPGPESTPEAKVSPAAEADWRKQAEGLSDDDLMEFLEKHPKGAAVKERLGQGFADKVLLKDRERITKEVREQAQKDAQEAAWQEKWRNMSRQERGDFMLQNQEMQEQQGRIVRDWWTSQSQTVKNSIPELKGKTIEDWAGYFEKAPGSWGETMAVLIEEVVKDRVAAALAKDVPVQAKTLAESMLKDKDAKRFRDEGAPDLRSSSPGSSQSDADHFKAYGRGESQDHARAQKYMKEMGIPIGR